MGLLLFLAPNCIDLDIVNELQHLNAVRPALQVADCFVYDVGTHGCSEEHKLLDPKTFPRKANF